MSQPLMKLKNYTTETYTYPCDIALPKFYRNHYKFFKIIIISHNLLLTSKYICHFLQFWRLNFAFSSFGNALVSEVGRRKVKKILYDKYVHMLTIKDDHVDGHFSDKFVFLCHVRYFINGDGRKLTAKYIYHIFYTFRDYIFYFYLSEIHLSTNYTFKDKSDYLPYNLCLVAHAYAICLRLQK